MTSVKTLTFAVLHFTVAFSVGYILTGSIAIGGLLALIEPTVNTVAFFFHERFWQRLEKRKQRDNNRLERSSQARSESGGIWFSESFAQRPYV